MTAAKCQASIIFTVLGLGLTATWRRRRGTSCNVRGCWRAVLSMNIVMPIAAALMATTFSLPLEVNATLVALAVSPVPPLIHKKQIVPGGRREYVVGLLVAMSVLAPLLAGLLIRHWVPGAEKASGKLIAVVGILLVFDALIVLYGLWRPPARISATASH